MPSQFGQDRLILELLGGLRGGFFLDSGASDGVRSSNTYLLETAFDWDGICVEPNDAFFAALAACRSEIASDFACLGQSCVAGWSWGGF